MRVLIHAGNPKTGSSSLQQYLHTHRDRLADVGVGYPDFGHRAHWLLSAAFGDVGEGSRAARRIAGHKDGVSLEAFRERCRTVLRTFDGELLIFSNEGLSHAPRAGNFVAFVREVRPDAEILVLDYIRDPVAHFPSATQQNLKAPGDRTLFPAHWISTSCVRGLYLLETMPELLTLRVFSPDMLVNGDIVDDFIGFVRDRTGIVLPANTDKAPRNASLSAPACAVLALRDVAPHVPLGPEERKRLGKPLRLTDQMLKPPRLELPDRFRQAIVAGNGADWNRLIDAVDADESTRAALRLPATAMPEDMDAANTGEWVIASLSEAYVTALVENIRQTVTARPQARLVRWLTTSVNETSHLHGVAIGDKDPASVRMLARQHARRGREQEAAAAAGDALAAAHVAAARRQTEDGVTARERAVRQAARQRRRMAGAARDPD